MITNILFFALACLALIISGTLLVKSLAKIAHLFKMTEFAAAFIIMSIATSFPELFVGISSALNKTPEIALGNIFGANMLDLTLIMGIMILAGRGIVIKSKEIKKDSFVMGIMIVIPIILFFIGDELSRTDGIILVASFVLYSYTLIKKEKEYSKKQKSNIKKFNMLITLLTFSLSLMLLLLSSKYVVYYANLLAIDLNLPSIIIGLFMVSLGTTLPELVFGVRAVLMGHRDMAIGDQIGTVIANSTLILGITSIIYPIKTISPTFLIASVFVVIISFLFATFIKSGQRFTIKEGIALISFYAFFVFLEFYILK